MKILKNNYHKIALLLIMMLTGFLSFYAVTQEGYVNTYYTAAVKSMLTSWKNFFFASFDPGGFVTVDKPAFGLWLQAISAFIFGVHGWSVVLPEALCAVISVAVIYHIMQRSFGKAAGLISALILSITPILIAVSRTNNLDSSLVLVLLLATWALIVASERESFKHLALSMILVGIGFNIKMLQAFMVLPAFYLVYLFTTNIKIKEKIKHLVAATAILLTVSFSWAILVDSIPANNRPYIGSSKTNSVIELALGYNGIQRLLGNTMNGNNRPNININNNVSNNQTINQNNSIQNMPVPPNWNNNQNGSQSSNNNMVQTPNSNMSQSNTNENMPNPPPNLQNGNNGRSFMDRGFGGQNGFGGPGGIGENGQKGILRIFNQNLAGQISWFIPLSLFGILILILRVRKKDVNLRNLYLRHLILWSAWLIPMIIFFSIAGFYHRYYLSMLAPGIAALTGIGIVEMWKAYMQSGWNFMLLPISLFSNALVQILIVSRYNEWSKYLIPIIAISTVIAVLGLIIIRILKMDYLNKTIKTLIALGLVGLLVSPAIWSYTPIMYGSQTTLPIAGPELNSQRGINMSMNTQVSNSNKIKQNSEDIVSSKLIDFLLKNRNGEKYIVAVQNANSAAPIILKTGLPVMAIGGFSGSDNILTVEKLKQMVKNGEIRFIMIGGMGGNQSDIMQWVILNGKIISADKYTDSSNQSNSFGFGGRDMGHVTALYDLAPEKGLK
ncbi:glycosyltransferase family 39 protein [Caldicellulosiruptoraceae bacterium PP1]